MEERNNNSMLNGRDGRVTEYSVTKVVLYLYEKIYKDGNHIDMTIIQIIIDEIVTPITLFVTSHFCLELSLTT